MRQCGVSTGANCRNLELQSQVSNRGVIAAAAAAARGQDNVGSHRVEHCEQPVELVQDVQTVVTLLLSTEQ